MSDSFPGKEYDGWIGFISPTAEFTPKPVETEQLRTRLVYQVRVMVKNPNNELRLGMPVTVKVDTAAAERASDESGATASTACPPKSTANSEPQPLTSEE